MNSELLIEYENLIVRVRAVLEHENRLLRTSPGEPDQDLISRKKELLLELEEKLERLRESKVAWPGDSSSWGERLGSLQQKFLQVLRLDRENEKLLLAGTMVPVDKTPPVNLRRVADAYSAPSQH